MLRIFRIFNLLFLLISSILLQSCATNTVALDTNKIPLRAIKDAVVKSLPIGLSNTSTNGREFRSHYFVRYKSKYRLADKMSRRSYAKVLVLGDQRPYTIEVTVINEQRARGSKSGDYSEKGTNKRIAERIVMNIKKNLSKRRKEINFIDDFRVF